jgi:hypothetical protein
MWEVTFKGLSSIMQFGGLAANLLIFKKPHLQKGTLDNGKGLNKENKSYANLSLFSTTTLSQKGVHLSIDHKLKQRQGQLLKLSLWKILMSYFLFL